MRSLLARAATVALLVGGLAACHGASPRPAPAPAPAPAPLPKPVPIPTPAPIQVPPAKIQLIARIGELMLLDPASPPPPGGPFAYAASGPSPAWNVAQWDIPGGQLSSFAQVGMGATAAATEASVTLIRGASGASVQLSQDGTALPCLEGGAPRESDLFLQPNPAPPYSGMADAVPGFTPSGPLNTLAEVLLSLDLALSYGPTGAPKGCLTNQSAAIVSVVLSSTTGSTLFYQLAVGGQNLPGGMAPFARGNPYGTDDVIPAPLASGQSAHIEVDLLPRLVAALAACGADTDPSHWLVTGAYFGQHIWGDVTMQTTWASVQMAAAPLQ